MGAQVVFLLLLSFPGCQLPSSEEMAEAGDQGDRCFRLEEVREDVGRCLRNGLSRGRSFCP